MGPPESLSDPADFDQQLQALEQAVGQSGSGVGARLDKDHAAETNGRMSICRKCAVYTNGPLGGHTPNDKQLAKAEKWLDGRVLNARLKAKRDT